jgi:zinc transport system ATP-binding protein
MPVLDVENLTVQLGDTVVVEEVSLTVEAGEIVAIIGPNGAGKTTLLKAVLGLLPIRSGTIRLLGKSMDALTKADRECLGYVPQHLDIDRAIPVTVQELIAINTPVSAFSGEALLRALTEVDAERLLPRQVGQLSGGELQRVLLAMNLLRDPLLLFLDEPATGIDMEGERLFYDILEQLRAQRKVAIIMVSHDISVVYRYASHVLCINRRLMCQGPPGDILKDETLERLYGHATAVYEHHD